MSYYSCTVSILDGSVVVVSSISFRYFVYSFIHICDALQQEVP